MTETIEAPSYSYLPAPTIEQAVLALASRTAPGGFSDRDREFGHSLALQIRAGKTLTGAQLNPAYRMLARYSAQLRYGYAIEYDRISKPPATPPPAPRTLTVDRATGEYLARFPVNGAVQAGVRAFAADGRRWDRQADAWRIADTPGNAAALEAWTAHFKFVISPEARALMDGQQAALEAERAAIRAELEASIAASSDFEVRGLGLTLYPYQRAGVEYAVKHRRTFIADQMGLGKTMQALATLQALGAFPAVLVVPASLKLNWRKEVWAWLPGRRVHIISGNAPPTLHDSLPALFAIDNSADLLIINYDVIGSWVPTLRARKIQAVVFDECHYLKNESAKRTKAAEALARDLDCILLLTGTPVLSKPEELLAQLKVMGRIDEHGGPKAFRHDYVKNKNPDLRGLNRKLRATCYVRRTKDQVLKDLPAKTRDLVPMELDNMKEYIEAEGGLVEYLRSVDMMRSKKAQFTIELAKIEALTQLCVKGMMAGALSWMHDFLETDEKLIMFGLHHVTLDALIAEFPDCARILGTDAGPKGMLERQRNADRFQTDPDCRLLVGAMGPHAAASPAGVGWTLTASSNPSFVEVGWTPGHLDQCEDRTHRIGQVDAVTAHYLIPLGTIMERKLRIIDAKRVVVDATTEGDAEAQKMSVLSDLIADLRGYGEDPRTWEVKA